ncbi:hypothetical protein [Akkermansia glycaniphila]|uniref:Uncharacterized protein n=1 Tax=Akkermansia glycaniphila TaxID=1679444 RepID=A0A1C7PA22_9BACT|nr:hypothetical protein [Akkermansia glycaniphila]OCA02328.1 hypothetical protein AC781_10880 [Akkermansia glycaniphila]OCA04186.1 hypothetical protein AC781_00390 [Akkermansia glycaniphila]SEH87739.1 Hypothetical protein PYTT_1396 [Akkermansia glycaniphila]
MTTEHRYDLAAIGPDKLTECTITYASLAAGTCSMAWAMDNLADIPVPWQYGHWVRLYRGTDLVFLGYVKKAQPKISAGSIHYAVEMTDPYDLLGRSIYQPPPADPSRSDGRHLQIGQTATTARACADLATALDQATAGPARNMPATIDILAKGTTGAIGTNGSNTCAQMIEAMSRWCPGLVSWMDYGGTHPRLVIADSLDLPVIDIPYGTCAMGGIDLTPRHDLVPPVVALKAPDGTIVKIIPEGGDLNVPDAFVYTLPSVTRTKTVEKSEEEEAEELSKPGKAETSGPVDAATAAAARQVMELKGIPFPKANPNGKENEWTKNTAAYKYWKHHFPFLAQVKDHVKFSTWCNITYEGQPDEFHEENPETGVETWILPANYKIDGQKYELILGSITRKFPSIRWCYANIEQRVCCTPDAPRKASVREFFSGDGTDGAGKVITRSLAYRVIAINLSGNKRYIGGDYGDASGDPAADPEAWEQNSTPEEEKEHGKYEYRYYIVHLPEGGLLTLSTEWFDALGFILWGDGHVTYTMDPGRINQGTATVHPASRQWAPQQQIAHTYAPGIYTLKLAARENESIFFTPHDKVQEIESDIPADLIRNYWDKTRALQYDGSLGPILWPTPWQLPGHRIRITGSGYAPWDTMDTTVQHVSWDLKTGHCTLTLGTRAAYNFDEYTNRNRVADLRDQTLVSDTALDPAQQPSSGNSGGSGGADKTEKEDNPVAPIFQPLNTGSSGGERRKPFEVYVENGQWWMNGGELPLPDSARPQKLEPVLLPDGQKYGYYHVLEKNNTLGWMWTLKKKPK